MLARKSFKVPTPKDRATIRQHNATGRTPTIPPLQWWRHLPAHDFTDKHLRTLRRAFAGIGMIGEPQWPYAIRGDAAAAVGVVLRMSHKRRCATSTVDLVASTLIAPALSGSTAAIIVLTKMIGRATGRIETSALTRSWIHHHKMVRRNRRGGTFAAAGLSSGAR